MTKHRYPVVLDCNHTIQIVSPAPTVGETLYCRWCATWKTVQQAPSSFLAKCITGSCPLAYYTGAIRERAIIKARQHILKRPLHTVAIYNGQVKLLTITNKDETLFSVDDQIENLTRINTEQLRKIIRTA